jgi:hypothetical protein
VVCGLCPIYIAFLSHRLVTYAREDQNLVGKSDHEDDELGQCAFQPRRGTNTSGSLRRSMQGGQHADEGIARRSRDSQLREE